MTENNRKPDREVIVVVDDIKDNVHFLMDTLKTEGYRVRPALNGTAALTIIDNETPDMVLLDIMMPVMNGYQVCEKIRENPKNQNLPIIFLSALDDVSDKIKGFQAGGIDYITKPFMTEEVLARVHVHLASRRMKAELAEQNTRLQQINEELSNALKEVKMLRDILPICTSCRKIRDESGNWETLETYVRTYTDTSFSHGAMATISMTEFHITRILEWEFHEFHNGKV
jgi:DNA-binding response OmpR family regulator